MAKVGQTGVAGAPDQVRGGSGWCGRGGSGRSDVRARSPRAQPARSVRAFRHGSRRDPLGGDARDMHQEDPGDDDRSAHPLHRRQGFAE